MTGRRKDVLSVTIDTGRGKALLRGYPARDVARQLGLEPKWSESARGWVVSDAGAADVIALAEHERLLVVVRDVTDGAA